MNEKVVYLAYSNPEKLERDVRDLLACKLCRNKTYIMVWQGGKDGETSFPMLQCAACGNGAGYWGFAGDDPPDVTGDSEN